MVLRARCTMSLALMVISASFTPGSPISCQFIPNIHKGTPPAQFRGLARQQISKYNSTSVIDIKIDSITPVEDAAANSSYFRAVDANGTQYTSRKVVLGTGLVDVIPDVPGLREAWGKGIWWCPWCDGYEHRDEPLGILGGLPDVVGSVMETHTLYSDIIAFTNGTYTPANEVALAAKYPNWKQQLEAWNVGIDNRSIASIERLQDGDDHRDDTGRQYDIFRVHFTDGSSVVRNTFITNYPTAQRSTLPEELSLVMVDNKIDTTDYTGMRTSLSGVYAVGDCNSDGSTNVPHAMFSGKRAGVYVHGEPPYTFLSSVLFFFSPFFHPYHEILNESQLTKTCSGNVPRRVQRGHLQARLRQTRPGEANRAHGRQ